MLGAQCRRNHIMTPGQIYIEYYFSVWHYTTFHQQQQQIFPSLVKKCASLVGAGAFFRLGQRNINFFLLLLPATYAYNSCARRLCLRNGVQGGRGSC